MFFPLHNSRNMSLDNVASHFARALSHLKKEKKRISYARDLLYVSPSDSSTRDANKDEILKHMGTTLFIQSVSSVTHWVINYKIMRADNNSFMTLGIIALMIFKLIANDINIIYDIITRSDTLGSSLSFKCIVCLEFSQLSTASYALHGLMWIRFQQKINFSTNPGKRVTFYDFLLILDIIL